MVACHNIMSRNYEDTYIRMLSEIGKSKIKNVPLTAFWPVIGNAYIPGKGCLIIGRAVNGWEKLGWEISELADDEKCHIRANAIRTVTEEMSMSWVQKLAGPNDVYNTNLSSFWRVIKQVVLEFNKADNNWSELIAWTNLCKVSPHKGG